MFDEILEKTKELGIMIANSEIRKELTETGDKINNDPEASKLIKDYNEYRRSTIEDLLARKAASEEIEEANKRVQAELARVSENPLVKDYMAVNKTFNTLVEDVNNILTYYINGENENPVAGCSGNCSSCSGDC